MKTQLTGKKAEDVACSFLIKNGLVLVTRNYRCRFGEIDLIMQDADMLVFVEVRYRKNNSFGDGAESVNQLKQRKLIFTANQYLLQHPHNGPMRFDVVALSAEHTPQWINNAFSDF